MSRRACTENTSSNPRGNSAQLEVLKRGNYFVCQVDGMHCRIIIDEFSSALTMGEHRLHVEEVSDRYVHHSKDGIFRLTLPLEEQDSVLSAH